VEPGVSRRFLQTLALRVADAITDKVLRSHRDCILELQGVPILRGKLIRNIALPDAAEVVVSHGLGHRAALFLAIPRRGDFSPTPGTLFDITHLRTSKVDPNESSVLTANDYGGTITVDLWAV
jgi:hypothetical protein